MYDYAENVISTIKVKVNKKNVVAKGLRKIHL